MFTIITLTFLLPLLSAICVGFLGGLLGQWGAILVTSLSMFSTVLISWGFLLYFLKFDTIVYINLFPWIIFDDNFIVNWEFKFDSLTVIMLVVVNTISFLVHIYSTSYMQNDPHIPRFMSYLSLFTFFMLILVTANNFLQLLIGWEGVGLSSYLLINFWFTRIQANKAALKAILVNKVGDIALILAIILLYNICHSTNFDIIFLIICEYTSLSFTFYGLALPGITLVCLLLLIAAIGKSAQLGLHTWLPDAMEGPTPVSALIHAATMVTAGIFLIIRTSFLFEYAPKILVLATYIGVITAFFGSLTGLFLFDIKKIIAYSTCSQLGYMLLGCGLSNYTASLYHLVNHAFFKALLFLTAGSIIHSLNNEQDIRKMGGLINKMPLTFVIFLIGSLSLMGTPFTAGYYSKDFIIETSYETFNYSSFGIFILSIFAALLTAYYSFRLIYLVFFGISNGSTKVHFQAHESGTMMLFLLIILVFGSIFSGFFFEEAFLGIASEFFNNSIFINPTNVKLIELEYLAGNYKIIPIIFSIIGIALAITLNIKFTNDFGKPKIVQSYLLNIRTNHRIFEFFNQKWYFDKIYNTKIDLIWFDQIIDKTLAEQYTAFWESWYSLGPNYFVSSVKKHTTIFNTTGFVNHYGFFIVLVIFCFIFFYFLILTSIIPIDIFQYFSLDELKENLIKENAS